MAGRVSASRANGKKGGRPKGSVAPDTKIRQVAEARLLELLYAELEPFAHALAAKAKGLAHFVVRNRQTGKFERITDPKRILGIMNGDAKHETWEIWTRDPDTAALAQALDRLCGRPAEQPQAHTVDGELIIRWEK